MAVNPAEVRLDMYAIRHVPAKPPATLSRPMAAKSAPEIVVLHREPDEQEIAQRPGERADDHRAQEPVARDGHASGEHAEHRHADAEDLPHLGDLDQAVAEVEIERIHDVQHEVRDAVEADQRENQPARRAVTREEIAQRIGERRGEIDAGPRARTGKRERGKRDHAEPQRHGGEMHPHARGRRPGRQHRLARAVGARGAEHAREHARIGGEA